MGGKRPGLIHELDEITTMWTTVYEAHGGSSVKSVNARKALAVRYITAIHRFVRSIVRNTDDAEEVAQEVVVKLMKGDFARATPEKGRFRDLLKVSTRNAARSLHRRSKRRSHSELIEEQTPAASFSEQEWMTAADRWTLLDRAWGRLRDYEKSTGKRYYTLLLLRARHAEDSIDGLGRRFSRFVDKPLRADALRQQLRRARVKFATFLVHAAAERCASQTRDTVQEELAGADLLEYVSQALGAEWFAAYKSSNDSDEIPPPAVE